MYTIIELRPIARLPDSEFYLYPTETNKSRFQFDGLKIGSNIFNQRFFFK